MPQFDSHIREWSTTYPTAARVFFGTLITGEMIAGESSKTTRPGFKKMHERGELTAVYNLAKTTERDAHAVAAFEDLVNELVRVVKK